jgi:hypothetical protein
VRHIAVAPGCEPSQYAAPERGLPLCSGAGEVFVTSFKDSTGLIFAQGAAMTSDRFLHLDLIDRFENAHGPIEAVAAISRAPVCREAYASAPVYPASYCHEPKQFAVAFDYGTPFSNKILTNGFSYVLRTSGEVPNGFDLKRFGQEVRSAFQSAVTIWVSAMADRNSLLSPSVREFIKSRTSTSSSFRLLTPPQVLQLECPHVATFVVELAFAENALFPRFPLILARAKIEGRTIALNMRFKCYRSELKFDANKQLNFETSDGCINLIPVMTHELGHAFGLQHVDRAGEPALMDSQFSRTALTPTDKDVGDLGSALERSITGAAPGMLEFKESAGVQPPRDWHPTR